MKRRKKTGSEQIASVIVQGAALGIGFVWGRYGWEWGLITWGAYTVSVFALFGLVSFYAPEDAKT